MGGRVKLVSGRVECLGSGWGVFLGGGCDLGGWRGDDRLMCPFGYLVSLFFKMTLTLTSKVQGFVGTAGGVCAGGGTGLWSEVLRSDSVEHEGTDDVPRRFVSQRGDVVMNEGDKKANLCEVASKMQKMQQF